MLSALEQAGTGVGALVCAASLLYMGVALWAMRAWRRRRMPQTTRFPPVTILKPLCGLEPRLYENLRSFCTQDYPDYQILFGVRDRDDPAIPVVQRLIDEHPRHDLTLIVDERVIGTNYKVSNLANMLPAARHDCLVIADSDIAVGPDYLRCLVPPLEDPTVGVVTCLYRGRAHGPVWSYLGTQFINEWFLPSVLVAAATGSRDFSFGSTLALRRAVLEDMGGFIALASHLADDYMLGALTRRLGKRTVLSPYLVETLVYEPRAADLVRHELRWARTIRLVQPWGYAGSGITHTFPVCLAGGALIHTMPWGLIPPLLALVLRLVLHYSARKGLQLTDPAPVWLVPWRDILSFGIWLWSYVGRRVTWRQKELSVQADGRIKEDKELLP